MKSKKELLTEDKNIKVVLSNLISDETIVEKVLESLSKNFLKLEKDNFSDSSYDNVLLNLLKIICSTTIRKIYAQHPELIEEINKEIFKFIQTIQQKANQVPILLQEKKMIKKFEKTRPEQFKRKWNEIRNFLERTYPKNQINTNFYQRELSKSLSPEKTNNPSFESVKEHLLEKWIKLFLDKQLDEELSKIDLEEDFFEEELEERTKLYKEMLKTFKNFTPINDEFKLSIWQSTQENWEENNLLDILKEYEKRLKDNSAIQELSEMLGRKYEQQTNDIHTYTQKNKQKLIDTQKSTLVGICESDDLNNLTPSEIVLLADEDTQWIFFKKFAEKKLQTFEHKTPLFSNIEDKEKGPIIFCIDTSGSMLGENEIIAKIICFAVLKIAMLDDRKCYLISFSEEIETFEITDIKNQLDKILLFLNMGFYGGTDAKEALKEALKMLNNENFKNADVIMISDFEMPEFSHHFKKRIKIAKKKGNKFHSLLIGNYDDENLSIIQEFDSHWMCDPDKSKHTIHLTKNIQQF